MVDLLNDPAHWQLRAEKARSRAEQFDDHATRRIMLEVAEAYDQLAHNALRRASTPSRD